MTRPAGFSLLLLIALQTATAAEPDPLFAADSVVDISIEAPFLHLMTERPNEEYVPAKLRVADSDVEFDIGIRTRGQHRRKPHICPFAPIRLNFKQVQTPNTLFENQDKLKLVTHCRDSSEQYEQAVLTEYLAYRILNVMTDLSYRVRLLRIEYVYTDADRSVIKPAFIIEADDRLSERLELPLFATDELDAEELDAAYTNLTSVFQFLIGNTDFSPVRSREGEECCHNHTPMGPAGNLYVSIPYDFDMAGIVNAKHSAPNPRFRLRSVRQRLYRGRCEHNDSLEDTLAKFREKRVDIETLVAEVPGLSARALKDTRRFLAGFYSVIENESRTKRMLYARCI